MPQLQTKIRGLKPLQQVNRLHGTTGTIQDSRRSQTSQFIPAKTAVLFLGMAVALLSSRTQAINEQSVPATGVLASERPKAIEQIIESIHSGDPFLRSNAIEAAQFLRSRALPLAQLGLQDEHPVVRFTALVCIGKLNIQSMGPEVEPFLNDPSPSVRAAAMYAARQCGMNVNLNEFTQMVTSNNPSLRGNAVMLLGMIGEDSALPLLEYAAIQRMRRPAKAVHHAVVRLQIAEARVRLGEEEALSAIRGGMFAMFDEVRIMAVQMIGQLSDLRMEEALLTTLNSNLHPIQLRLAAAEALARSRQRVVTKVVLDQLPLILLATESELPTVRTQAAMTLGRMEQACAHVRPQLLASDPTSIWTQFQNTTSLQRLASMLDDPNEQVRLAAASALVLPQTQRVAHNH